MTRTDTDQLHVALNGGERRGRARPGGDEDRPDAAAQRAGRTDRPPARPLDELRRQDAWSRRTRTPTTPRCSTSRPARSSRSRSWRRCRSRRRWRRTTRSTTSPTCWRTASRACRRTSTSPALRGRGQPVDPQDDPDRHELRPRSPARPTAVRLPADPDAGEPGRQRTCSRPTRCRATIAVIDTETDTLVKYLPCDAGCHGINFGAKKGGGYYGYVSNKFSNRMVVIDGDPNGDGDPADADDRRQR